MTVNAENVISGPYLPNGVTTVFPFDFEITETSEVAAYLDGVLVNSSLYNVTLNDDGTGSASFFVAPTGAELWIASDPVFSQQTSLQNQGAFFQRTIEKMMDRLTAQTLWLRERISYLSNFNFLLPSARAGRFMSWDVDGNPTLSSGTGADAGLRVDLADDGGSALVGFKQAGTGAVVESVYAAIRRRRYADQYALANGASLSANLLALQRAYADTPTGATLIVPAEIAAAISVSGGLSAALLIDRQITLLLEGELSIGAWAFTTTNPNYLFNVTADKFHVAGNGTLAGNGVVNDVNINPSTGLSYTLNEMPGLIYCTGDELEIDPSVRIVNPPKNAIALVNCYGAKIGARAIGGITGYADTAYFLAVASGGGEHVFDDIRTNADAGGRFVNLIYTSGLHGNADGCTVRNCYADVLEKLFYGHGSGHLVENSDGLGYGHTDWIRFHGGSNRARKIKCSGAAGLITCYDGADNTFEDVEGRELTQSGIAVSQSNPSYTGGFGNTFIIRPHLYGAAASTLKQDAILINTAGGDSDNVQILDPVIKGFADAATSGTAPIRFEAPAGRKFTKPIIRIASIADSDKPALILKRVEDGKIFGGKVSDVPELGQEANCARNTWHDIEGSNITTKGISGLSSTSKTRNITYTTGAREGDATLAPGAATVNVTNGSNQLGVTAGELFVGQIINGTGIPTDSRVTVAAGVGGTAQINVNATATNAGVVLGVSSTVLISTTEVMAGDRFLYDRQNTAGVPGHLWPGSIVANVSFRLFSSTQETSLLWWKLNH
jgi:hypothetical protein